MSSIRPSFGAPPDKCVVCDQSVYPLEMIRVESQPFHKTCFRCKHCNLQLTLTNFAQINKTPYCKTHYIELFKSTGGKYTVFDNPDLLKQNDEEPTRAASGSVDSGHLAVSGLTSRLQETKLESLSENGEAAVTLKVPSATEASARGASPSVSASPSASNRLPLMSTMKMRVFVAGPSGNNDPQAFEDSVRIASELQRSSYDAYIPSRDGLPVESTTEAVALALQQRGEHAGAEQDAKARAIASRAAFVMDVYNLITHCFGLVLNVNGVVADESASAQAALAFAAGLPVVSFKQAGGVVDSPFVVGLSTFYVQSNSAPFGSTYVTDHTEVSKKLQALAETTKRHSAHSFHAPANLAAAVDLGKQVHTVFNTGNSGALGDLLVTLFA